MKIGILKCGHANDKVIAEHGDYERWFEKLLADKDLEFAAYNVVDLEFPASVSDCDGWLLTGSRHGAYEDHPFIAPLEDFIRAAYSAHVPMVGICFGHQLIAQALGGKVEKYSVGWAMGNRTYDWNGLGDVALNAWHQDQVVTPPKGAKILAGNDFCKYAALIYDDRAWTVQAHPEITNDLVTAYLDAFAGTDVYPQSDMDTARALEKQPNSANKIADEIAAFFKKPRNTRIKQKASHV